MKREKCHTNANKGLQDCSWVIRVYYGQEGEAIRSVRSLTTPVEHVQFIQENGMFIMEEGTGDLVFIPSSAIQEIRCTEAE